MHAANWSQSSMLKGNSQQHQQQDLHPTCSSAMSNASSSSDQELLFSSQQQQVTLHGESADPHQIRAGDLCNTSVFQQFVQDWLKLFGIVLDSQVTQANEEEKKHLETTLKAKKLADKKTYYHCRLFLKNFYPTVFFGCGYGLTMKQSSYSAAKDLVNCLRDSHLISSELFELILKEHLTVGRLNNTNNNNSTARTNKEKTAKLDLSDDPYWLYSQRVTNAFMELVDKESFPIGFKEGTLCPPSDQFQEQMNMLIFKFKSLKPKFGYTTPVSEERKRRLSAEITGICGAPATPTAGLLASQGQIESPNKRMRSTSPFLGYRDPAGRTAREVSPDPDDIVEEEVVEVQPSDPVQVGAVNPGSFSQQDRNERTVHLEVPKTPNQTPFSFGSFNPNTSVSHLFASVASSGASKQLTSSKEVLNASSSNISQLSLLPPSVQPSTSTKINEKSPTKVVAGAPIWRSPANFKFAVAASHDTAISDAAALPPPPKPPVFDLSDEEMPGLEQSKDDEIQILPPVPHRIRSPTTKKLQKMNVQLQVFNAEDLSDGEELFAVFSNTPSTTSNAVSSVRSGTTTIARLRGTTPSPPRGPHSHRTLRSTSPTTTTNLIHAKTVNRAIAPAVVTNGGTATSSSSSSSTQLCDGPANGRAANGKGFNWREKYGVWPDSNFAIVYNNISGYRERFKKEFNTFNKGIWNHLMNNLQNDETFAWKMRIRKELNNALCEINPECLLIAVGSTINGCGAYNCDMDLCLCLPCPLRRYDTERSYALSHLKRFKKRLMRLQVVKRVEYIPAKVPILKLWFNQPYEQLEVDLNVNNMPGIFNSYLLHYYSRIDDKFPALCLLVKHWAKRADINEASQGTFNSYSLILMVLHFLQVASDPPILPNLQKLYPDFFSKHLNLSDIKIFSELPAPLPEAPRNTRSVGELLIAFFDYYVNFDYENVAISIARGKTFPRSELPRNTDRFKVFIEEPFDFQNTARCVTRDEEWELITEAFAEARNAFLNPNYQCPPTLQMLKIPPVF